MPPEFHWWTARVPLNLVYPSSAGSTRGSSPVGTRRTTNRKINVPAEPHVRRNLTLKPGNVSMRCDGPPGFRPVALDLYVPARRRQTSEFPVSDADISCGRSITLLCLLLEKSNFLPHTDRLSRWVKSKSVSKLDIYILTVFVVHWRGVFLISTVLGTLSARGVFATMRYINWHLHYIYI